MKDDSELNPKEGTPGPQGDSTLMPELDDSPGPDGGEAIEYSEPLQCYAIKPNVFVRAWDYLRYKLGKREPSQVLEFARSELEYAGLFDADADYGGMLGDAVMNLLKEHEKEGHSGFSNHMVVDLFSKLATFTPLTPLSGDDDEWGDDVDGLGMQQNRRESRVFRSPERGAWTLDAVVFREPSGATYTSSQSAQPITFPYTRPETVIVDVPDDHSFPDPEETAEGDTYTIDGTTWMLTDNRWLYLRPNA